MTRGVRPNGKLSSLRFDSVGPRCLHENVEEASAYLRAIFALVAFIVHRRLLGSSEARTAMHGGQWPSAWGLAS